MLFYICKYYVNNINVNNDYSQTFFSAEHSLN